MFLSRSYNVEKQPEIVRGGQPSFSLTVLSIAILLAGLTTIFFVIRQVLQFHSVLPVFDHWIVFLTLAANKGKVPFTYLWALHNEHRIFIPKLFYFSDVFLFSATGQLLMWSGIVFQALCGAFFFSMGRLNHFSKILLTALSGLLLIFLFSPVQIENFAWSFQVCFLLMDFFATAALFCMALYFERTKSSGQTYLAKVWLAGSILSATCASLTLANGLGLWPLLVVACLLFRLPFFSLFWVSIVGIFEIVLYMWGYHTPGYHSNPWETITRPDLILAYLCAYIGGPWSSMGLTAAIVAGALGLVLSGVAFWHVVRLRSAATQLQFFCVMIMLFELFTGGVTSLGRIKFGIAQAYSSRYQSFALLLWLALILFFLDAARRTHRRLLTQLILIAGSLFCLPGLLNFRLLLAPFENQSQHLHDAELALLAGVDDRESIQYAHPDLAQMAPAFLYLRQNKLSAFSHTGLQSGPNGKDSQSNHGLPRCEGAILRTRYVANVAEPGFKLEGWGWNGDAGSPLSDLIVVDEQNRVIGVGRGGMGSLDADYIPAGLRGKELAWTAYAKSSRSGDSRSISVISTGGGTRCQIGIAFKPPKPSGYVGSQNVAVSELSKARIGIFRNGQWWMDVNGDGRWELPDDKVMNFGQAGDIPVEGNWGADSTLQMGLFRGGQWWLDVNGDGLWQEGIDRLFTFGAPGDLPIVGDWDNSGKLHIGVYRAGQWWLDMNGDGRWTPGEDKVFTFGQAGDYPVVGDWDGTGKLRIGVFRAGQWFVDLNGNDQLEEGVDPVFNFGEPGDIPVVGNWDGMGKLRIGIFRRGRWWLDLNGNNQWDGEGQDTTLGLGQPGDLPVVGNFNKQVPERGLATTRKQN